MIRWCVCVFTYWEYKNFYYYYFRFDSMYVWIDGWLVEWMNKMYEKMGVCVYHIYIHPKWMFTFGREKKHRIYLLFCSLYFYFFSFFLLLFFPGSQFVDGFFLLLLLLDSFSSFFFFTIWFDSMLAVFISIFIQFNSIHSVCSNFSASSSSSSLLLLLS